MAEIGCRRHFVFVVARRRRGACDTLLALSFARLRLPLGAKEIRRDKERALAT